MTSDRYPNLFISGAPKCGTTSLAYYIGQHPDMFTPLVKEPVFFGSDLTAQSRMKRAAYLELYRDWSDEALAMDASTHYLFSHKAAGEMHAASPDAHVIIMVRNPVDASYSMYHQLRFNGAEHLESFEASLEAEAGRSENRKPMRIGFPENFLYRQVYAFSKNIERFEGEFGADRVHVSFLDDLKVDPIAEVKRLCQAIGLDPVPVDAFSFGTQNTAKKPRARWVNTLANYPPEWLGWLTAPFSKSFRIKLRKQLARMNTASATNPKLGQDMRDFLEGEFDFEIKWLERRFERDLDHWRS